MKRLSIIFLVLIFLSNIGNCQEYEKIVDTTKMWVTYQTSSDAPPYCDIGKSFAYKISDSVKLDNCFWYKLWRAEDSLYSNWGLSGYIREDNKIVFFQNTNQDCIDTLYNFNLNIGDTIYVNRCGIKFNIYDVDTVYIAGKNRRTQHVEHIDIEYYEGVGSNAGLLFPYYYCRTGVVDYLLCYYENGELKYHNPNFESSCYINTLGISDNKISGLKVYQNLATNKLIIKIPETYKDVSITIYNLLGKKILQTKINSTSTQIALTDLNARVYLYLIKNNRKILSSGKIIINR